jgi:hypothetical protein
MSGRVSVISKSVLVTVLSVPILSIAQEKAIEPDLMRLVEGKGWKISNRAVAAVEESGKKGIRFDERLGDGVAWLEGTKFANGVIECDIKGNDVFQNSFVGLAFRGVDEKTQDVVYCRPFNFRAADPERRSHAVQYVSHPTYTWSKLRNEHPAVYEKPVDPAPDPNGWFHLRIVVSKPKVSVYINDAKEPSLVVQELSERMDGWVGLWVGNTSGGTFANLKITPGR